MISPNTSQEVGTRHLHTLKLDVRAIFTNLETTNKRGLVYFLVTELKIQIAIMSML